MILLDTNVISAFMHNKPERALVAWLDDQAEGSIWTTTVSVFEIEYGIHRLPKGKRRRLLETAFDAFLTGDIDGRILPFDTAAAQNAGALSAALQARGVNLEIRDVQIAGIARVRSAPIVTRNAKHFDGLCSVINPWAET